MFRPGAQRLKLHAQVAILQGSFAGRALRLEHLLKKQRGTSSSSTGAADSSTSVAPVRAFDPIADAALSMVPLCVRPLWLACTTDFEAAPVAAASGQFGTGDARMWHVPKAVVAAFTDGRWSLNFPLGKSILPGLIRAAGLMKTPAVPAAPSPVVVPSSAEPVPGSAAMEDGEAPDVAEPLLRIPELNTTMQWASAAPELYTELGHGQFGRRLRSPVS